MEVEKCNQIKLGEAIYYEFSIEKKCMLFKFTN